MQEIVKPVEQVVVLVREHFRSAARMLDDVDRFADQDLSGLLYQGMMPEIGQRPAIPAGLGNGDDGKVERLVAQEETIRAQVEELAWRGVPGIREIVPEIRANPVCVAGGADHMVIGHQKVWSDHESAAETLDWPRRSRHHDNPGNRQSGIAFFFGFGKPDAIVDAENAFCSDILGNRCRIDGSSGPPPRGTGQILCDDFGIIGGAGTGGFKGLLDVSAALCTALPSVRRRFGLLQPGGCDVI